jgi:hypothetical protein
VVESTAVVADTPLAAGMSADMAAGTAEAEKYMNTVQVSGIVPEEEEVALLDFETAWMRHCWEQYLA